MRKLFVLVLILILLPSCTQPYMYGANSYYAPDGQYVGPGTDDFRTKLAVSDAARKYNQSK